MNEKGKCKAAVTLAIWGGIIGFIFLPSIGVTLSISGLIVNTMERRHYDTSAGFTANIISMILSIIGWIIGAKTIGFI